ARLRDRRPRRRGRRQLRADDARQDHDRTRRDARRPDEPAVDDAVPREPALFAKRHGARAVARLRRRAEARLVGRHHRRRMRRRKTGGRGVSTQLVTELTILMLAIFLGFEVISKVPTLLHTPLMSGTNAIHGIVVVGAMVVLGSPHKGAFGWVVGFLAVVLGSANVVGGFVVTDRMLEMFKKREAPKEPED